MPLLTISDLSIGFRGPALLDSVSCVIESRQRIGLLGRNGAGKTTLMKILAGQIEADSGKVILESGRRVALLPQEVPSGLQVTVAELIKRGLDDSDDHLAGHQSDPVQKVLSQLNLDGQADFDQLSSGWKRRVLMAQALVNNPDLLLLDEPTNHLDIEAIEWLESFLIKFDASLLFITHDRMFLRRLANRILEIEAGRLFDWTCDYETFLKRKEQALHAEAKQDALFDKKLAEEEVWIRQGIKARRTRNEGRVRALKKMREERRNRRAKVGTSNLQIDVGEKSGQRVVEVKNVSFGYDDKPIIDDFSTLIVRGDKVGIIGPNGAGKSTLLKLLLGKQTPQSGTIEMGTHLQVAYFDQLREQLDPEQTIQENVGDGSDHVEIGGARKHIYGYLQEFLFTPERARTKIKFLSGGERNRILLAKLFAKPANLIVLDEPTNDLDTETLEMLEERLVNYEGTLLVVSHDRTFLNNVVGSCIVFEAGQVKEYIGGYDDWKRQSMAQAKDSADATEAKKKKVKPKPKSSSSRKLKYAEQQELQKLPQQIEQLEMQVAEFHQAMADPGFYQQESKVIAAKQAELNQLEQQVATAYQRWEELEAIAGL